MIPHMCMNHSNISYNRIQFLNKTKDPTQKKREQVSTTSTSRENGEERKTKYM